MIKRKIAKTPFSENVKHVQMKLQDTFKGRQAKPIVIGFCGPVGSGIKNVISSVKDILKEFNYESEAIKISDYIVELSKKTDEPIDSRIISREPGKRILALQKAGNSLRLKYGNDILSQVAVKNIAVKRVGKVRKSPKDELEAIERETPTRTAFLIDSLKHPDEINLLRTVYRNMFYLFGIICPESVRLDNLKSSRIHISEAHEIIEIDKNQPFSHGQKLVESLQYADFFIRNNHPNKEAINNQIKRFFNLAFGTEIVTPTSDEFAMFIAQSSALRSACLSRQVGASILSNNGEILSTGCNDVPCFDGGLYSIEHKEKDSRCAYLQDAKCFNQTRKEELKRHLANYIDKEKVENFINETWIKDVIEFSRAVHAEMDAIVSAARNGYSIKGCTLFTTTFPCHNCARHIIAAGIKRVVYIEPYEKSHAKDLHIDAISLDPQTGNNPQGVAFFHFEGIAPRQYMNLFKRKINWKKEGKMVSFEPETALPIIPEYLDTFLDFESKVQQNLKDIGLLD